MLCPLEKQPSETFTFAWNCLILSLIWTGVTCFSTLKVFGSESRDEILLRGGCNTLGVTIRLAATMDVSTRYQ
jgi:hypothetical protein